MKIEKLIIQNLNSIENAEIIFSEGVLAKEPLFLICGETGSGKTTILDAITLALYDKASRYENVRNNERTENGNNNTKNTANILRKGKSDGKAELYFSVKDTRYVASWLVHKTRSNTYASSNRRKLEILDGDVRVVLSTKIEEVNRKIEELVGLSYEQFVRSVMLAQGEFSTFLKSKKNEQSEILEMLTGTEIYSKIAEAVKTKKGEAFFKKKEAETLYNSLKDKILSQDEIAELNDKQEKLTLNLAKKEIELKSIESSIAWYKKDDELHKEYDAAKLLYDKALMQVNSQQYKDNQIVIDDYFKTSRERAAVKELQRLESELINVNENIDDCIRDFINLIDSIKQEKNNKEKLLLSINELNNWIENHKDNEMIFNNLNVILGYLNDMLQIFNLLIVKKNELNVNNSKKNDVLSQLQLLSQSLDEVKKSKQEAESNLEKLLKDFNSDEYQNLIEEQQKLDEERKYYIERNSKLNNVRTVLEQYLELSQNLKNERDRCDNLKLLFNEKNGILLKEKLLFDAKDLEFQKQKEMVEDWAKEYRSKLNDGEPCPVCGSKEHYYKDENVVCSLFASIENEWKNSKESYEKAKDDLNKSEVELSTMLRNINSEEKRLELMLNNLNNLCNGKPIFEIERIDTNIQKYNELIINLDKHILDINEKLKNITIIKKNIDETQKNKRTIDDNFIFLEKQFADKQNEYQQIELTQNTIETIIKEQNTKLIEIENAANEYIKIDDWKQSFINSPDNFIKFLNKIASEWQSKKELLKDTENKISNIEEILSQCDKITPNISDILPKKALYMLVEKYPLHELIPLLTVLYERSKEKLSQKNKIETDLNSFKLIIEDFINNNSDFTFGRLKFISEINDIQSFVQKNKTFDDELIKSKNTLTIKSNEYDAHQNAESKPKNEVSLNELELLLISLKNEKKLEDETMSEVKMKLAMNNQNYSDSVDYHKDLEEKDRVYHLWEQLAKAIGTTDGDNFRDVAQAYTMGILLDRANYYMKQLSSRYKLANYPDSLAIMVQDMEMGGELRAASSLSGGETFLVSLALALGLTSLNDEHFNIDMLFIDEGFGTLDNESLDMVMNTLENLHNIGRKVGIISHVDTLKERIPAKIQLVREGKSASRVEVIKN